MFFGNADDDDNDEKSPEQKEHSVQTKKKKKTGKRDKKSKKKTKKYVLCDNHDNHNNQEFCQNCNNCGNHICTDKEMLMSPKCQCIHIHTNMKTITLQTNISQVPMVCSRLISTITIQTKDILKHIIK